MRKNFGKQTYLYPMPVLIIATYDKDGNPDAMNAAWGGISEYNQITICIDDGHKTYKNILEQKAFTVSVADASHVVECDYVGIVSANDTTDKFNRAGFTASKSAFVNAPIINELFMTLECKLSKINEDGLVVGEIVNVSADESVLDKDGKISPALLRPITYDPVHHDYIVMGDKVGKAFSDGRRLK